MVQPTKGETAHKAEMGPAKTEKEGPELTATIGLREDQKNNSIHLGRVLVLRVGGQATLERKEH